MIHLETDIEGKQMSFGDAQKNLRKYGLNMGGGWDYDRGIFDYPFMCLRVNWTGKMLGSNFLNHMSLNMLYILDWTKILIPCLRQQG